MIKARAALMQLRAMAGDGGADHKVRRLLLLATAPISEPERSLFLYERAVAAFMRHLRVPELGDPPMAFYVAEIRTWLDTIEKAWSDID